VYVGWIGVPATLAWLLFATNAVNFIDGLNGLASGVTLIACGFLAFISASYGAVLLRGQWAVGRWAAWGSAVLTFRGTDIHGDVGASSAGS